jgi:Aromatic acid exporter family member 1
MSPNAKSIAAAVAASPARLRDPVVQADLLLVLKAAGAAVVAWLLAVQVFDLSQPFLAPWSALLTVHATVYRSVSRGAQQVGSTVLGVLLSFVLAELLGINGLTLFLAMLAALLLARVWPLRDEGMTVATTALFVLTTGYGQQEQMLGDRILATVLGIGVGVLVNLLVLPPLNNRSAAQHVDIIDDRLGRLLCGMAEAVRRSDSDEAVTDWIDQTRRLDRELDHAWESVGFARESTRLNPRRRATVMQRGELSYEEVLYRLEDGIAETRSMARTIRESTFAEHAWDRRFREPWVELLDAVGQRVRSPEADVSSLRERIDALTRDLSVGELAGTHWPLYGALLTNLRNIVDVVDDVATTQHVRETNKQA